jgi:Zn-dependent protease
MSRQRHRYSQLDDSEARLLAETVGPGRYRVLTRRPVTVALGPGAYAPALMCGFLGFAAGIHAGFFAALISGAISGVGIAVAVAAHEVGHLLCSRRVRGLVPRILLLRGSGGASIVEGRFESPRGAAVFAAGGPIASAAVILVYVVAALLAPWTAVSAGFIVPAIMSAILLGLNLLPVAPTDGYALFRSLLWAETGSRREAELRAIAWSRAVLAFGLVISLELLAEHQSAAISVLVIVATLIVQHHAVARRVERG